MKKRFLSLIIALAMMVGVFTPLITNAADETTNQTKVRIHKILMDEDAYKAWPEKGKEHDGSEIESITDYFGAKAKPIDGVAFRIYKVYTGTGKAEDEGYTKGSTLIANHKLATGDLVADKYYKLVQVNGQDFVLSANGGIAEVTLANGTYRVVEDKTNSTYKGEAYFDKNGNELVKKVEKGETKYYNGENEVEKKDVKIIGTTLTGMKAVPFDLVLPAGLPDGTGNYSVDKPLNVYPKNVEKGIQFDKNFAKENGLEAITDPNTLKDVGAVVENYNKEKANAKAQIGKEVPYEAKAELPKGNVFKNLDLADSMDKGLKYNAEKGVTIKVSKISTVEGKKTETELKDFGLVKDTHYTVETVGNGFKVHFNQSGLDKLNKAAETDDLAISFTYYANVTAEAIADKPMDNHATLTYNHQPPKPSSDNVTPVNKEIKVTKDWALGEGEQAPTNITVKYVLLDENMNAVADVTFTDAKTVDGTDLGNGITFEIDDTKNYAGSFKGLEDGKNYKVKELVNGYEPEYTVADGNVSVKNTKTPESITPTPPQVTVGGKKFVKTDKDGNRLAGAEFVISQRVDKDGKNIKNTEAKKDGEVTKYLKIISTESKVYNDAETAYNNAIAAVKAALAKGEISDTNKVTIGTEEFTTKDEAMAKIKTLQETRDKEFVKANLAYKWVDNQETATKFYSNGDGQFEVKGIEYGDYRAVETKAPAGYALPTDGGSFTFTVANGSYTKDNSETPIDYVKDSNKKDAMQIKNNTVTIPQTGGIGTVIFTAIGLAIMASAIIAIKKRQATEAR